MSLIHRRALGLAVAHYLISFGCAFLLFAQAWGSGLSDSYNGDPGFGWYGYTLILIQAPVALVVWLAAHFGFVIKSDWLVPFLALLAVPCSLGYGYALAFLLRVYSKRERNRV